MTKLLLMFVCCSLAFPLMAKSDNSVGTVLQCDELAAHPKDPSKKATGIGFNEINAHAAIAACQSDLANDPNNMRLVMNLGRAYNRLGQYKESFHYAKQSADGHYPFAIHLLSLHYFYGEGTEKNQQKEIEILQKAANLGIAASYKRLADIKLEAEPTLINYDQAYDDIKNALALGETLDETLGDFYYQLNEKIKFSILNAKSVSELNLVKLQIYRDNLITAKNHYNKYIALYQNDKISEKLKTVTYALENTATEDNIKIKIALKKSIVGQLKATNQLEFNYEFGSKLSIQSKAKKWGMLTDEDQFLGLPLTVNGSNAKIEDTYGEEAWRTAEETWQLIKPYEEHWNIVIYGKNQSDVRDYILALRQAMLDSKTHAWVYVVGVVG